MIKITRRLKANNFESVDYEVYPKEEFKKLGKKYKHWDKCSQGDWGISDDGYVAECLQRNIYGTSVEMVFPYGRQWAKKTAKLEFEPHYHRKNYSNVSTKSYAELEAGRDRAELAIDAFLAYKLAGETPDMYKIGKIYRPDQKVPTATVRRFLKQKVAKRMVEKKIKELLLDKAINKEFAVDNILRALTMAENKGDVNNFLKANDYLMDLLEMKPNKQLITDTIQVDMTKQIADTIAKEDKRKYRNWKDLKRERIFSNDEEKRNM